LSTPSPAPGGTTSPPTTTPEPRTSTPVVIGTLGELHFSLIFHVRPIKIQRSQTDDLTEGVPIYLDRADHLKSYGHNSYPHKPVPANRKRPRVSLRFKTDFN
jgi:hypothetical protein